MIKNKGKEFLKVLGISALSIGLFSAAFVGINTLAFAASTSTVESLPPVAATVVIPAEQTPPEGFTEPEITVRVNTEWSEPSANALPADDAAIIAAQYIWHMFDESIEGKIVTLWYSAHPSHTRAYWMGSVSEPTLQMETPGRDASREEVFRYREQHASARRFSFTIDAVTGEWIDILRSLENETSEEVWTAFEELSRSDYQTDFYELRRGGASPKDIAVYAEIAKEHASRHFANTEVVIAEFMNVGVSQFDMDENGNIIATARQISFEVTDNTGRVATVSFDEATGVLFHIHTIHNDIVPGFRFDDGGQGRG